MKHLERVAYKKISISKSAFSSRSNFLFTTIKFFVAEFSKQSFMDFCSRIQRAYALFPGCAIRLFNHITAFETLDAISEMYAAQRSFSFIVLNIFLRSILKYLTKAYKYFQKECVVIALSKKVIVTNKPFTDFTPM